MLQIEYDDIVATGEDPHISYFPVLAIQGKLLEVSVEMYNKIAITNPEESKKQGGKQILIFSNNQHFVLT